MEVEFGELPERKRLTGNAATPALTDDAVAKFEERPGQWGKVAKDVVSGQKFSAWATRMNGDSEGPWWVATRAHLNEDGTPHIKKTEVQTGKNKGKPAEIRYVDVWVCYNPDGKPKELQAKS